MDAASNMPPCMYRSGYDVSLPLAPKKTFHALAEIAPLDRAFFLTFKVHARAAVLAVPPLALGNLRQFLSYSLECKHS